MNVKNLLKNLSLRDYLKICSAALTLVSVIFYAIYAVKADSFNVGVVILALLGVAVTLLSFRLNKGYVYLAAVTLLSLTVCVFICETRVYGTFVDWFNKVNFFGDVKLLWLILTVTVLNFVSILCNAVNGFIE